jgi:hypothetical protein
MLHAKELKIVYLSLLKGCLRPTWPDFVLIIKYKLQLASKNITKSCISVPRFIINTCTRKSIPEFQAGFT